ncbi:hypothetical protein MBSD_n1583 [Mizugakiibacter sediminis]|uniref:Uncharacterized protein n=1 Tax=Mizugakiibacter sediminis TaxID=1475481 RepID=A0A0K8QN27_9GAMM|nr:hypothetical protein [Mizugakiibacter sediminis]GAP66279.1 hypothetical protein MBSD_n1583 [Mizugakiibacter sediminis]
MGTVIQLNAREVLILIGAFTGLVFGFGRLLLAQFEKRMDERFRAQSDLRDEEKRSHAQRMEAIENSLESTAGRITDVVHRVEKLHASLPLEYVRREDWIRFASTIDAKLDRLADMITYRNRGAPRE